MDSCVYPRAKQFHHQNQKPEVVRPAHSLHSTLPLHVLSASPRIVLSASPTASLSHHRSQRLKIVHSAHSLYSSLPLCVLPTSSGIALLASPTASLFHHRKRKQVHVRQVTTRRY